VGIRKGVGTVGGGVRRWSCSLGLAWLPLVVAGTRFKIKLVVDIHTNFIEYGINGIAFYTM